MTAYVCPHCNGEAMVEDEYIGSEMTCPHCTGVFLAEAHDEGYILAKPIKVPFFKMGKRKALAKELDELIADGDYSETDAQRMGMLLAAFNLDEKELVAARTKAFRKKVDHVFNRIYSSCYLSPEDESEIRAIGRNLKVDVELDHNLETCKAIYALEVLGELPFAPIENPDVFLKRGEKVYHSTPTSWAQYRSRHTGYSGTSVSIPTGMKGVRFRFGNYVPSRVNELTVLSDGLLHVTNKRLIFDGQGKSTTITFGRLVDLEVYSDALCVEKTSGKADYFLMSSLYARYIKALVRYVANNA